MKKFLILTIFILPVAAFSAPSVRMLGANSSANAAPAQKITPAKSTASSGPAAVSRVGTLRATPKTTGTTGAISGSNSRFPIITAAHPYNSVITPAGGNTGGTTVVPASVDTEAIVNAVTQRIENNYYDTTQVYNNNEFVDAVKGVLNDDARFDAIRTSDPSDDRGPAPAGYVYIWIEQ